MIKSGRVDIEVDGIVNVLLPGEVGLLKPGHQEMLNFSTECPSRQTWFIMRPELLPVGLASRIGTLPFSAQAGPRIQALMEMALDFSAALTPSGTMLLEQLVVSIFCEFFHTVEKEGQWTTIHPEAVLKTIEYVERNYGKTLSLNDIAKAVNVTPHHLIKLFQKHMHDTPMHYLWHLRTQRGAELLRTTGLNVSEVAFRTGFQSPFHFSRMFKDHFEVSPKEFRKKLWENMDAAEASVMQEKLDAASQTSASK